MKPRRNAPAGNSVTVEIAGLAPETGVERSKRAAEQVAATKMLEREGVWQKSDDA